MALLVLALLLLSAFIGLIVGRHRAVVPAAAAVIPAVAAVIPCALLGGAEIAGLALLAAAGVAAGVHLHRVVAEASVPRAG